MDITQIESLILSEWQDFYIDYKKILKILNPKISKEKKEENNSCNNIDNTLEEKLLNNNEQNEEENKGINSIFKKYITQLNLDKNKIDFFDNLLQNKRHNKRFEEIIEQLKYIEKNETIKIFKKQLLQSLKNLYREISNYDKYYLKVNYSIMTDIINPEEEKLINQNDLMKNNEDYEALKKIKNEISLFFEKSKEYSTNFLSQIKEQYEYYSCQNKDEDNSDDDNDNLLNNNSLPNEKRLIKARLKLKLFRISCWVMFILIFLCSFIYFFYLNIDIDEDPELRSVFPMYRTYGIICLYLWTLGVNVWAWNNASINYKALFTFDNHYSTETEIFIRAAAFTNILFFAFLLHMIAHTQYVNSYLTLNQISVDGILPGIIWFILLVYFFWPFKNFNYYGRIYTMRLFGECIASILIPIEFKHIWFMDQLTSLIGPLRDVEYTLCYYSYYVNPFQTRELFCSNARTIYLIIAIFPNLFRCLQVGRQMIDNGKICPYIFNIGKYTFNIIVATFSFLSTFHPNYIILWIISAFISGCYSSYWDIKMDFGYFEKGSKNWPLRDQLKFKNKKLCLAAIPIDIILRFLWMLSISHEIMSQIIKPEFLALILYTLEMIRRAQWNFIRVEFEHFELVKGYQISYYEELPLVKLSNGKFITNEHNLLNILNIEKHDRIRLELKELFISLDKDTDGKIKKETSLAHMKEEKKYANAIVNQLNEYLVSYRNNTKNNLAH